MVQEIFIFQIEFSLNFVLFFSENFEKIPSEIVVDPDDHSGALPRIVLWGVTLTISGLAIYIWNHSQRTDPTTFISLGDFLAQLYRH